LRFGASGSINRFRRFKPLGHVLRNQEHRRGR